MLLFPLILHIDWNFNFYISRETILSLLTILSFFIIEIAMFFYHIFI